MHRTRAPDDDDELRDRRPRSPAPIYVDLSHLDKQARPPPDDAMDHLHRRDDRTDRITP